MILFNGFHILTLLIVNLLLSALLSLPVYAAGQTIVCVQCHSGLEGRLKEPVSLWEASIHAANGIACNGCHGGDPADAANAMDPARGFLGKPDKADIPAFCGRCHVGVLKEYQASPHAKAPGRTGPTCVTCHGNHLVKKASIDLINEKTCSRCHEYAIAREIREAMLGTESRITEIDKKITEFKGKGLDTNWTEKTQFSARNRFHTLFHMLDMNRVKSETAGISSELDKIESAIKSIDEDLRRRKLAGAAAIALTLIAALLLKLYAKSLDS